MTPDEAREAARHLAATFPGKVTKQQGDQFRTWVRAFTPDVVKTAIVAHRAGLPKHATGYPQWDYLGASIENAEAAARAAAEQKRKDDAARERARQMQDQSNRYMRRQREDAEERRAVERERAERDVAVLALSDEELQELRVAVLAEAGEYWAERLRTADPRQSVEMRRRIYSFLKRRGSLPSRSAVPAAQQDFEDD
jgi:hypothetical protein